MSDNIPKVIHKVLLLDEGRFHISTNTHEHHESWQNMNPGYKLMYWDFQKCRLFLAKIGSKFLSTFDSIVPYSGKVDFFRYCILYFIGGWYSDWNQIPLCSISNMIGVTDTDKDFYYFDDYALKYTKQMGYAQTCFIGCVPQNIVMRDAIALCMQNVQNEVYGVLPIDSTACGVITKAIHRNPESSCSLGYFIRINNPGVQQGLPVLISRSLNKVAIIHKICKTLQDENMWTNGNNYTAHWRTKTYYKSSNKSTIPKLFFEDSPSSNTETICVSLYAGEGLFFALRDEILSLMRYTIPPGVLLTYHNPKVYIDTWRMYVLSKLTKSIHFNGDSKGALASAPSCTSKDLIRPVSLIANAFDETRDGSLKVIGDSLRSSMNLNYEPTEILFLIRKGQLLDSLTGKPVESLLEKLAIKPLYPEEISMEDLFDGLRRATFLIVVHGDYLANMVFVSRSCSVLEITTEQAGEQLRKDACWHNLARALGLRYEDIPSDKVTEEGVFIDLPVIMATIREKALARSNIQ